MSRELLGQPVARYSEVFVFYVTKAVCFFMESAKLSLLQNERLESFWHALWLGIRPFSYFPKKRLRLGSYILFLGRVSGLPGPKSVARGPPTQKRP